MQGSWRTKLAAASGFGGFGGGRGTSRSTNDGPSWQQLQPHFNVLAHMGIAADDDDDGDDSYRELPELPLTTTVMPLDASGPLAPYCPVHREKSNAGWWGGSESSLNIAARESPHRSPITSNESSAGTNLPAPMSVPMVFNSSGVITNCSPLRKQIEQRSQRFGLMRQ
jgi:hypothetical protein